MPELPPIPQEAITKTYTLEELHAIYKKWLHIQEDYTINAVLCAVLGNFVAGEVDIIGIVGPSGSLKTELLRCFGETENQYIYPISSITEHTFISGFKGNQDTIPLLRCRAIIIKDLTTMLSRKEDIRAGIFADFRELTDGYMKKEFGSGVKREYKDIHSSIIFASTNAIERYYSMYSSLGARMVFVRPRFDPTESRIKSATNQLQLKAMRDELHAITMGFLKGILKQIEDMKDKQPIIDCFTAETIGKACDFIAKARTTIHKNFRGEMDEIPEPEAPTRLYNTVLKLTRLHILIQGREESNDTDKDFAFRILMDNLPKIKGRVFAVLSKDWVITPELAKMADLSTNMAHNVLDEMAALKVVEKATRGEQDGRADAYRLHEDYLDIITQLRVVIPQDDVSLINKREEENEQSDSQHAIKGGVDSQHPIHYNGICEGCGKHTEVQRSLWGVLCKYCVVDYKKDRIIQQVPEIKPEKSPVPEPILRPGGEL